MKGSCFLMNIANYIRSRKYKNSKLLYNIKKLVGYCIPNVFFRLSLDNRLSKLSNYDLSYINERVNYYNKLEKHYLINEDFIMIKEFVLGKGYKPHSYFFDAYEYLRYFDKNYQISFLFGDIIRVPAFPRIVKSRPIKNNNENSVILNLDKLRHFLFVDDQKKFQQKKDMLIGRGALYQPHRIKFYEQYFGHPLCNLGQVRTNNTSYPEWNVEYTPIADHLDYKFILCLEGNDVASNLKWVMSSNSLAVMPKPKYETWFMEGTLIPNYHYVEIKGDYSDLEEKLNYYIENTDAALAIIENAHRYIANFKNNEREDLISLLVLQKYFKLQESNTFR